MNKSEVNIIKLAIVKLEENNNYVDNTSEAIELLETLVEDVKE